MLVLRLLLQAYGKGMMDVSYIPSKMYSRSSL
jgi:hypothetical protein